MEQAAKGSCEISFGEGFQGEAGLGISMEWFQNTKSYTLHGLGKDITLYTF